MAETSGLERVREANLLLVSALLRLQDEHDRNQRDYLALHDLYRRAVEDCAKVADTFCGKVQPNCAMTHSDEGAICVPLQIGQAIRRRMREGGTGG